MYSGYTTAAFSLRAKCSLNHGFSFDRRTFCSCNSCCCCSNGAPINPRSLYGYILKQSTLIQWAPSRRLLAGGPRRFWSGFDGGFREMIGLLAELDDLCSDYNGGGLAGKRRADGGGGRKGRLGLSCYAEDRGRRWDDESVDEEEVRDVGRCGNDWRFSRSNSWKFRIKEEKEEDLLIDSGGRRRGGSDDVKKVRSSRARADDVKKVSDWRDEVEVNKDESLIISRLGDRRGNGRVEQRGEGSQKLSGPRDVVEGREKRCSSSRRVSQVEIRDMEDEASSSIDSGNDAREKYVQEEPLPTRRSDSREEESQRILRTVEAYEDDSRRSSSLKRVSGGRKANFVTDSSNEAQKEYVRAAWHGVRQEKLKEGSRKVMRISEAKENENMKVSSSSNLVDSRKVDFSVGSALALKQQGKVEQRVAEHAESRMSSGRLAEISEIHDIGVIASSPRNRKDQSTSIQKTGDKRIQMDQRHGKVDQKVDEHAKSRTHSGRFSELSEMHDETDIERSSISRRHLEESRVRNIDDQYSVQHSVQVSGDKRIEMEEQAVKDTDLSKQSNLYKGSTNTLRISESQQHFVETQMKDREDQYTTVQESIQVKRDARARLDQQVVSINRQYGNRANVSGAVVSDARRISSSQTNVGAGVDDHERSSTSVVNQVQGVRRQTYQRNEQVSQQYAPREEYDGYGYSSEISRSNVHRTFDDADLTNSRTEAHSWSASSVLIQDGREKQGTFTGRSFQSRGTQTALSGSLDTSSTSEYKRLHERDDQTRASKDETYIIRSDVLESASWLDKSSSLFVGEFVDKLTQEIPTSDALDDAPRQALASEILEVQTGSSQGKSEVQLGSIVDTLKYRDKKQTQESARKSSSRSGPEGPKDEMWEVGGPSSQKSSRIEELEEYSSPLGVIEPTSGTIAEGAITKRSHRSLWTYIADIIHKGWFSSAQSHTSTLKSGMESSSNDSLGSEAWFSGHEPDDNFVELSKKGGISSPKEVAPVERSADNSHPMEHPIASPVSSEVPRVEERLTPLEGGRTASVKVSEGASRVSRSESLGQARNDKQMQGLSSGTTLPGHSSAVSGDTALPTVEEDIAVMVNLQIPGNEISKSGDELKREKEPEVQEPVGRDMELKRRKLQRNKQVLKETFDEWEEAYKLEIEQRKIDEFFMKEALLEAKKAADSWEVPVGAVLVQRGRIIARGCNLVEELRDSTAHAEMICIREASNLLKTWRLAETTLYVTLEPCPMCAGAILQARIDTVVWGAPNKLLGADGSWVRLFPGDGGSSSLDVANQIPGPVHPFHPKITIRRGILAMECADAMQQFFKLRRKDKKPESPPNPSCLPISSNPAKLLTKMQNLFCIMFCL